MRRSPFVPLALALLAAVPCRAAEAPRIPLREGLTIVTALHEPGRGDYESMKVVVRAGDQDVRLRYSGEAPEAKQDDNPLAAILGGGGGNRRGATGVQRISALRTVRRQDLETAHTYQWVFYNDAPEVYAGATAVGLSAAALDELKGTGATRLEMAAGGVAGALGEALGGLLGASAGELRKASAWSGTLKRVAAAVPFKVLLNDDLVDVPAVHARGRLGGQDAEFWILDDAENPLALKWTVGRSRLQVIKIAFPPEAAAARHIERDLRDQGRAVVYGIHFDFASDRIKDESEPVLREITRVLAANPAWTLSVEGHTDSIGTAASNLDLSQRRAAAVKRALGGLGVAAHRLAPSGFGASRPQDTNETLEGRARNRRVELVRQTPAREATR
jgi:outer membrane protein OmpA-like peptidoglycan-associated protein